MIGRYSFDGDDFYTTYGGIVTKVLANLLKFPDSDPVYTKKWPGQHGVETYLDVRTFKPRPVPIEVAITADSPAQFWQRHKAFFNNVLGKPGKRRFYSAELERSFYIYYDKCTGFEALTRIQEVDKIGMRGTVEFIEPVPSFWEQFTFMTDENGNYILTEDNNKIIVNI